MKTPGWDYVCFTDNRLLLERKGIWEIRLIQDSSLDHVRLARKVKILGHAYLPDYDLTIWCDSNIKVNCNLDIFLSNYHKIDHDFSVMQHPERRCIYQEAGACTQRKKDNFYVIKSQINRYKKESYPIMNGLVATGILIRPKNEKIQYFMTRWWEEVVKGSYRDQLSFNYVLWHNPLKLNLIPFSILSSEFLKAKHKRI